MLKKGVKQQNSTVFSLSSKRKEKDKKRIEWYKFVARINFYQEDVIRDGSLEQMRTLLETYSRSICSQCINDEMKVFLKEKSSALMKAISDKKEAHLMKSQPEECSGLYKIPPVPKEEDDWG